MRYENFDENVLLNLVRANVRIGNWNEVRVITRVISTRREAKQLPEGDPTVWL